MTIWSIDNNLLSHSYLLPTILKLSKYKYAQKDDSVHLFLC